MFTSVTGLFAVSLSVCEPLAYEPPTTETVAVFEVSETRSNTPFEVAFGLVVGKIAPVVTDSETPFTAMTAVVGGGVGGAGGVAGGDDVPEPEDPDPDEPVPLPELPPDDEDEDEDGPPPANGSLLSKCENDSSWPGSAGGLTAASSWLEPVRGCCRIRRDRSPAERRRGRRRCRSRRRRSRRRGCRRGSRDGLRAAAAVERHHRVDRIRHREGEEANESDRDLLLLCRFVLRRVGRFLVLGHDLSLRAD